MSRMRYIKPEFWTDGKIVALSFPARLLYIGMWNFAMCDQGHVEDDLLRLKMQVFPGDDVDTDRLVEELIHSRRVVRLEASDGTTYLHVVRLPDHQKVDPRWSPRCPACKNADDLTETLRNSPELSQTLPNSPQEGIGGEGRGEERRGVTTSSDVVGPASPPTPPPTGFDDFWAAYPRKDAKRRAESAYRSATRRASPQTILDGAIRYRDDPHREDAFTSLPTTWLNGDRWDDAPLPNRNGKATDRQADILRAEMVRARAADAHRENLRQIGASS